MLGAEKLLLPRLPEEPPPPALAQALDSRMIQKAKLREINSPMTRYDLFFAFILDFAPVFKVLEVSQTLDTHGSGTCLDL